MWVHKDMKKQKTSLSFIITTLVVGLVTLFLLWSTFYFFSLYVGSMKQAAHTSSEQAVTQASNTISNYIGDMQEIMSLIEKVEASVDQEQAQEMQKKLKKMDYMILVLNTITAVLRSISMMSRGSWWIPIRELIL